MDWPVDTGGKTHELPGTYVVKLPAVSTARQNAVVGHDADLRFSALVVLIVSPDNQVVP